MPRRVKDAAQPHVLRAIEPRDVRGVRTGRVWNGNVRRALDTPRSTITVGAVLFDRRCALAKVTGP